MVFFTCSSCGESLKKAQVEKHVSLCGASALSCIDCGQDFWGNTYRNHIRCISEDQKYGGRGYEAKANKGDVKQQLWLQKVQAALSRPGLSASLRSVLQQVATYDNVPRKKSKFQNWMKNSLKISNCNLHEEVWNILSADSPHEDAAQTEAPSKDAAPTEAPPTEAPPTEAPPTEAPPTVRDNSSSEKKKLNKRERKEARRQKNGLKTSQDSESDLIWPQDKGLDPTVQRKRKQREELNGTASKKTKNETPTDTKTEPEETEQAAPKGKFNWKGNIKALLRDAPDQELPVKKLRKKVLRAFHSFSADSELHKSEEQLLALFNKKINKNPKFRLLKDRVKLIQ